MQSSLSWMFAMVCAVGPAACGGGGGGGESNDGSPDNLDAGDDPDDGSDGGTSGGICADIPCGTITGPLGQLVADCGRCQWERVRTNIGGGPISFALTPDGAVVASYNSDGDLNIARESASGFDVETIDLVEGPSAFAARPDLVFGPDGLLWLAFEDQGLNVGRFENDVFVVETVAPLGQAPALAFDAAGVLHLAYADPYKVMLGSRGGADDWDVTPVDDPARAERVALAFDEDEVAHLLYLEANSDSVRHASATAGPFTVVEIVQGVTDIGGDADVSIAANGEVLLAMWGTYENGLETALRPAGADWTVTPLNQEDGVTSVTFDAEGRPRLAFSSDAELQYAVPAGQLFAIQIIREEFEHDGVEIAFDADNHVHIAHDGGIARMIGPYSDEYFAACDEIAESLCATLETCVSDDTTDFCTGVQSSLHCVDALARCQAKTKEMICGGVYQEPEVVYACQTALGAQVCEANGQEAAVYAPPECQTRPDL